MSHQGDSPVVTLRVLWQHARPDPIKSESDLSDSSICFTYVNKVVSVALDRFLTHLSPPAGNGGYAVVHSYCYSPLDRIMEFLKQVAVHLAKCPVMSAISMMWIGAIFKTLFV